MPNTLATNIRRHNTGVLAEHRKTIASVDGNIFALAKEKIGCGACAFSRGDWERLSNFCGGESAHKPIIRLEEKL
jgi:hypothetical protein